MASKSVVPSKDALHALRQLAFSASTLTKFTSRCPALQRRTLHLKRKNESVWRNRTISVDSEASSIANHGLSRGPRRRGHSSAAVAFESSAWKEVTGEDTTPKVEAVPERSSATASKQKKTTSVSEQFYEQSCKRIHDALESSDEYRAAHLILSLCNSLAEEDSDWAWSKFKRVQVIYASRLSEDRAISMRYEILKHTLSRPVPKLEAVAIFARDKHNSLEESPASRTLMMYLRTFCHHSQSVKDQVRETIKILRSLQRAELPLDVDYVLPFVRSAVYMGETERAYRLLKAICKKFNLRPSPKILHKLVQGFSGVTNSQGDWSQVDEIITFSHHLGYSRDKRQAHANLVLAAVIRFAQNATPARVHDYLTYHLGNTGLIPDRKLCRWVYLHYFAARRFDLAQRWAHTMYSCFPGMVYIGEDQIFAYDLAALWEAEHVSCVEILDVCKILTHGAVRNPFSEDLGLLIREAISVDLRRRAQLSGLPISHSRQVEALDDINQLFEAISLELSIASKENANVLSKTLLFNSLWQQLRAAQDVMLALTDYSKFLDAHLWVTATPITADVTKYSESGNTLRAKMSAADGRRWLAADSIENKLETFVNLHAQTSTLPRPDVSAKVMTACLSAESRYTEIALLLQNISRLPFASEVFSDSVLHDWISAAAVTVTWTSLRDALWYYVTSPSTSQIPTRVLLHAHRAVSFWEIRASRGQFRECYVEEMQYLRLRLFRRWWIGRSCPDLTGLLNSKLTAMYKANLELERNLLQNTLVVEQPEIKKVFV